MSKALSLKLNDQIFSETEKMVKSMRIPRNTYINKALNLYNRLNKRKKLKKDMLRDVALLKQDPDPLIKELDMLEDFFE